MWISSEIINNLGVGMLESDGKLENKHYASKFSWTSDFGATTQSERETMQIGLQ